MTTLLARRGAVASPDGLASSAGLEQLARGGTAADAAVAASAVLAVTSPHMCGMGGDLLAVARSGGGEVHSLLAVGRAGSRASAQALRDEGLTRVPLTGDPRAVTVPGCVDGWLALHAKLGRLPLADVLAPAAALAEDGFPVSPLLAAAVPRVAGAPGAEELTPGGEAPVAGALLRRPGHARALREIAANGREAWYGGAFGRGLTALPGGTVTAADLAQDCADWSAPLRLTALGGVLWGCPAPSSSYLVLASAGVAERLGVTGADPDDPAVAHALVEASRVAGHDRHPRLHDGAAPLPDDAELDRRAALVDPSRPSALRVPAGPAGTVFLVAVDDEGGAVSLGQSNGLGFGAGVGLPGVGVMLQSRGLGFSLVPGAPDELAPGRRPPHTLAPVLATEPDGRLRAVVGSMGGDAQPQLLLQLLARLAAGQAPGEAVDAPRWALAGPDRAGFDTWRARPGDPLDQVVQVERGAAFAAGLAARGHQVEERPWGTGFGHAHAAVPVPGGYAVGSDRRALVGSAAVR